ncbi:MAG: alkaline phosphatase family protein [Nitrososphaerales archaeon]|nr:alkaline phosphatase family protein [Nitrososphaerales archaeon]
MVKLLYVLLDGAGDLPDPTLNLVTPLEAAYTPSLDSLARLGVSGLVYSVGKGISPESDIAVFNMLSYDFSSNYVGRGVVEAVGAGMEFRDGYLALRGNFATIDEDLSIIDRRAGRDISSEEANELAEAIKRYVKLSYKGASFDFVPTVAHRCTVVFKVEGVNLSANISNTDPAYTRVSGMGVVSGADYPKSIQKCLPLDNEESSRLSASLVNEFSDKAIRVLRSHPVNLKRVKEGKKAANAILLRDAGNQLPKIPSIYEKFGMRFACIADLPVEIGIARLLGMEVAKAGGLGDYEKKAEVVLDLLKKFDGVYVHLKGPDEPGHDGNAKMKKRVIEEIDRRFFARLIPQLDLDETLIVISSDHSTPCRLKAHTDDPVPLLVVNKRIKRDNTCRFTERDAAKGSLGVLRGVEVLAKALSLVR